MKGYQALPEERCGNCLYFCKHYAHMYKELYVPLEYGHCVHPRIKKRRAEEHCPHWAPAEQEKSAQGESGQ